jgi:hypothetical protein
MSNLIQDGTGSGSLAAVDSTNRLQTFSTTQSGYTSATQKGDAYIVSTGIINLTSANESALLYIQSTETSDVVIQELTVNCGLSNVTGDVIRTDYIAPTTGTLLTDQTVAPAFNLNSTSSKTFSGTTYKGAEGKTVGGAVFSQQALHHQSQTDRQPSGLIIPKGASLGLTMTPPAGNTSLNVSISYIIYLLDSE